MTTKEEKAPILDIAILITTIPGLLYLYTYLYIEGIVSVYQIPMDIVSIDFSSVVSEGASLFLYLACYLCLIVFLMQFGEIATGKSFNVYFVKYFTALVFTLISAFVTTSALYPDLPLTTILLNIVLIGIGLVILTTVVIVLIERYSSRNPNNLRELMNPASSKQSIIKILMYNRDASVIYMIIIIAITCMFLGRSSAARSEDYLYYTANKKMNVVLWRNDNNFITREYDPKTNTLSDSLMIFRIGDNSKLTLYALNKKLKLKTRK